MRLVPVGRDHGDKPGEGFQEGVRVLVQIGGVTRELLSTAQAVWTAMDQLYDAFIAQGSQHPGQLPIVEWTSAQQRTNNGAIFRPIFKIVGWIARPPDMPMQVAPSDEIQAARRVLPTHDMNDEIPT
jgi:hypothetical protein